MYFGNLNNSKMVKYYSILMILGLLCIISCQEDKSVKVSSSANQIEKDYFEDYESPKHKWGFIDENGQVVIDPKFDDVGDMIGPLTSANLNGKWGYIDVNGQEVIPHMYKQAYDFEESRAIVQTFDNNWQIINNDGKVVSKLNHASIYPSKNGVSKFSQGDLFGLMDQDGKVILDALYNKILTIDNNKYIVKSDNVYSIIDSKAVKLTTGYEKIYRPLNGKFKVKLDGKYGFLNADNYSVIGSINYDMVSDFGIKAAAVKRDGQYKLISHTLTDIATLPYDKVEYIENGMWKYKSNGKWGLLNNEGQAVSSAKFDLINKFSDGLVAFSINELWGYANELGLKAIPAKYQLAWDFQNGKARVIDQRGVGFINKKGKMVVSDIFLEVRDFHQGKARFQTY